MHSNMKQLKNKRRYRLIGILLNLSKVYEKYLYTRISPCLTIPFRNNIAGSERPKISALLA